MHADAHSKGLENSWKLSVGTAKAGRKKAPNPHAAALMRPAPGSREGWTCPVVLPWPGGQQPRVLAVTVMGGSLGPDGGDPHQLLPAAPVPLSGSVGEVR